MKILGIHDGHLSTASLLVDGKLVAAVSEERLTRKKGQGGPPREAIRSILLQGALTGSDIDLVALAGLTEPLTRWEDESGQTRRRIFRAASALLPSRLVGSHALRAPYLAIYRHKRRWKALNQALADNGISADAYADYRREHHECHAATAYFLSWFRDPMKPMLIVTVDGSGDGLSATVSIGKEGRLTRLRAITSYHSLGELYGRVTEMLGMKPLEHEYKVMGLAPYAPPALAESAYRVYSTYYKLADDDLSLTNTSGTWGPGLRDKMRRDLKGMRFDGIAAGVQRLIESIVPRLVRAWVLKTGVHDVAVAGGVFMNVKLNMLLSEMPEIDRIFFMPSCGDESVGIGASLLVYADDRLKRGQPVDISPLDQLYLGPEYSRDEILAALAARRAQVRWSECGDIQAAVARHLAEGQIVARMAGRMEWGARSLGNRAILADPRDLKLVRRLNRAIKMRDFWMPFAPSILEERSRDYLDTPRALDAPYMINAFRSTPLAQKELICGLHPFDLSCRPQIVTREANPSYHRLIREFEKLTGVGGVVNTSFNLHGEPMVCGPAEAIDTLVNSDLDALAIENLLVWRK